MELYFSPLACSMATRIALYEAGALFASMSGSGASVFGIFEQRPDLSHLEDENVVFYDI